MRSSVLSQQQDTQMPQQAKLNLGYGLQHQQLLLPPTDGRTKPQGPVELSPSLAQPPWPCSCPAKPSDFCVGPVLLLGSYARLSPIPAQERLKRYIMGMGRQVGSQV